MPRPSPLNFKYNHFYRVFNKFYNWQFFNSHPICYACGWRCVFKIEKLYKCLRSPKWQPLNCDNGYSDNGGCVTSAGPLDSVQYWIIGNVCGQCSCRQCRSSNAVQANADWLAKSIGSRSVFSDTCPRKGYDCIHKKIYVYI